MSYDAIIDDIFGITGPELFNETAIRLFHLHAEKNPVYRGFLENLDLDGKSVESISEIPMLPIGLFKSQKVLLDGASAELTFSSSGTTGGILSQHSVADPALYQRSFIEGFKRVYGDPCNYRVLGLLPSYLERGDSSLVYMVNELIKHSNDEFSGMYLDRLDELASVLKKSEKKSKPTLLIGVSFALLDLSERHPMQLKQTTIIETGGMKGRRKELIRSELHTILQEAFGPEPIHSEYGMTELLSQAWSKGEGVFHCPPWMRVRIRDTRDPFTQLRPGRTGGIDIIDLANVYSCPFIATQDLGKLNEDGSFEVLGRFDASDIRGCNLMVY